MASSTKKRTGTRGRSTASAAPAAPPRPGGPLISVLVVVATLWLVLQFGGLHTLLRAKVVDDPRNVVNLVLYLSGLLLGATFAGAVLGTVALWLADARPASWAARQARYAVGAAGGVLVGVLAGGTAFLMFSAKPGIAALLGGVCGVTAIIGGVVAALRPPIMVGAGLLGGVVLLLAWFGRGYFRDTIVDVLKSGDTARDQVNAYGWYALSTSLLAGVAVGLIVYVYLRRRGARLPLFAHLFAGAMPGLMWLLTELLVWAVGSRLLSYAGEVSPLDEISLGLESEAQFNGALAVLFAGAMTALLAVGLLAPRESGPGTAKAVPGPRAAAKKRPGGTPTRKNGGGTAGGRGGKNTARGGKDADDADADADA